MSLYSKRGVSAQKEEVHAATSGLDKGLYQRSFCKLYPDHLGNDADWVNIMHADGAGTKSILAYLYWKETGDINIWKGIAEDAIVMNLDDLLCTGIYSNILFSSTIDRNKKRIPGQVLKTIIDATNEFFVRMREYGVEITFMGGETADVGDVVRTIAVNGTMTARWPKDKLITNDKIAAGQVIVGLASYGQSTYETSYNSGIASNGLTSARHDVLSKMYSVTYPESFEPALEDEVVYIGKHSLSDKISIAGSKISIGELLCSPTRTFAPVMKELFTNNFTMIKGLIHCSGGGQTKCLKYLPDNVRVIKDNLLPVPPIFDIIQKSSGSEPREMYQVFNMGTRMEIYCDENDASEIISKAKKFDVDAAVIGRVEQSLVKELIIRMNNAELSFQ